MMTEEQSFLKGAEIRPDYYCCNSGSALNDPATLGMDTSLSLYQWQKHDLELMLLSSRKQGVPMMIASAGDTGSNSRVDLYVNLIQRLAWQHNLSPFKLVYFYSEVPKETLRSLMEEGLAVEEAREHKKLSLEELENTDRILAIADARPFMEALELGADVIIGGRSDPAAVFASAAMHAGFPGHLANSLAQTLNTTSHCDEALMVNETIIGTISAEAEEIRLLRPKHHNSSMSLAVRGREESPVPETSLHIPLEGIGKVGERFMAILELRDPLSIHHLDTMIEWAQQNVEANFSEKQYLLSYNVYDKGTVRGDLNLSGVRSAQSPGLMVEGIAETEQLAEELTVLGSRSLVSAPQYEHHKSMGHPGIVIHGIFPAPPAYRWTIQHSIHLNAPMELFTLHELVVE